MCVGFGGQNLVAQWYPLFFFIVSGFPYKVTNPKKGCPYCNVLTRLPRTKGFKGIHKVVLMLLGHGFG